MDEKHEFSVRFNHLREDGRPGPLRFRFLPDARAALDLIHRLDALDGAQVENVTIARRPIGRWEMLSIIQLEALAHEESGR